VVASLLFAVAVGKEHGCTVVVVVVVVAAGTATLLSQGIAPILLWRATQLP
jgi:hypothetical protein